MSQRLIPLVFLGLGIASVVGFVEMLSNPRPKGGQAEKAGTAIATMKASPPNTAGPDPTFMREPHPSEKNEALPVYRIVEHYCTILDTLNAPDSNGVLKYDAEWTTRAVMYHEGMKCWRYWDDGRWENYLDRRSNWEKKHGYGDWVEIWILLPNGENGRLIDPKEVPGD